MHRRKISYEYYVISLNIVMIIILLGALAYIYVDSKRYLSKQDESEIQNNQYLSLQLQYTLLNDVLESDSQSCSALNTALQNSIEDLGSSLDKLLEYQKDSINDEYYENLEHRYVLDNVKYWMLAKKAKELCELDKVIILYFFSDNCEICPDQGVILSYYKKTYDENILVFPINVDNAVYEPVIQLIMSAYEIDTYPSIVVDDVKYEGIIYKDELGNILGDCFARFTKNKNVSNCSQND